LMRVRSSLELPSPTEELIESFRWAFSHFVRRHGIFHYLVQRGSKILMEDNYWDYRNKVYEVRRCVGNLEEALAEAYAITRCQEDLQNLPKYDKIPYEPKELTSINKLILERIFINKSRPPGYRDAEYFLNEFKLLYDHPLNIQVLSALANEELWDILKGIGWLFHEITVREAKDFTDPQNPPARPYSRKEFITFLENFRKEEDTFWLFILPLPMEEVSN
ncbi:MAG: hypothetical protein N3F06_05185, partial [Nitrososphaerales archaeon]|nr:hypothetical protein [Nitrososphaerales archaeon]